jgi:Interferon-induced transmembrane protein
MGQPGYPGQPQQPPPVDNNMTMSIVSIFLFWPLAIPAIINASKVNPLLQQGDYAGAQAAAVESKKWSKIALIVGIIWYAVVVVCCIVYFAFIASAVGAANLNSGY